MPPTVLDSGRSIRWLHISDLHIQDPRGPGNQGDQRDVLDAFLRFCRHDMLNLLHFEPDFVFITGDLAFGGSTEDYTRPTGLSVEHFLDELLQALPSLDKSQLFVVSGNHDVRRDGIGKAHAQDDVSITKQLSSGAPSDETCSRIVDRLFPVKDEDGYDRDGLIRRHEDFAAFCVRYFGEDRYSGYSRTTFQGRILPVLTYAAQVHVPRTGHSFGLAGLCSTWASQSLYRAEARDDTEGSQFICIKTVRDALAKVKDTQFRIALVHHPPAWLIRPERERLSLQQGSLFSEFDMVLAGHTHEIKRLEMPQFEGLRAMQSSAGAVFDGWGRANAFNLVEMWPLARQGRRMVVGWQREQGIWAPDMAIGHGPLRPWREFRLPAAGPEESISESLICDGSAFPESIGPYCRDVIDETSVTLLADAKRRCQVEQLYVHIEVSSHDRLDLEEEEEGEKQGSNTKSAGDDEARYAQEERGRLPVSRLGLCDALRDNPVTVLVGGPGLGKTTCLKWLASQTARQYIGSEFPQLPPGLDWLEGLTPVRLSARHLHEEREREIRSAESRPGPLTQEWLFRFLRNEGNDGRFSRHAEACVRRALRQDTALFLIDGLDEVPSDARRWIVELAERFPRNRMVFSTRPGGYDPLEHGSSARALYLLPFDRVRIGEYLNRWFSFRREWKDKALSDYEISTRHMEMLQAIDSSAAIRSLADIPLLLATMACVQELTVRLPENRAELYHRCSTLLLGQWTEELRPQAGVPPDPETRRLVEGIGGLDLATRRQLFEIVAYRLFITRPVLNPPVHRDGMITLLQEAVDLILGPEGRSPKNPMALTTTLLRLATQSAGLLVECAPNHFKFLHATMQEYLAASFLRGAVPPGGDAEWSDILVANCHDPHWREVIRLTVAELVREPSPVYTNRLNGFMDRIGDQMKTQRLNPELWIEVAETAIGCLEDLGNRSFPAAAAIASEIVCKCRYEMYSERPDGPTVRALGLAFRLPSCLARRSLLDEVSIEDLAAICLRSARSHEGDIKAVWAALRPLASTESRALLERLASFLEGFALFKSGDQLLLARALLDLCDPKTRRHRAFRLAVEVIAGQREPGLPVGVAEEERKEWNRALEECEDEPRLFLALGALETPLRMWSSTRYARAAVRALAADCSRETGRRVLRMLLADVETRPMAMAAVQEGVQGSWPIALASTAILSEVGVALPGQCAHIAVQAFYAEWSLETGVRVIRGMLKEDATRGLAVTALQEGLNKDSSEIAVTSALILAEEGLLPHEEGTRALVRAFRSDGSRKAAMPVIRGLLADRASREPALAALRAGLTDDRRVAGTCGAVLAEDTMLPSFERAQAAIRTFSLDSSRAVGMCVIRELHIDPGFREAASRALYASLADNDRDIAMTSAACLADARLLPAAAGARVAVAAFYSDRSRERGIAVIRGLLVDEATRDTALTALRDGLGHRDRDIVVTCAHILAQDGTLSPTERVRAAVRAFSSDDTREAAVLAVRALLAGPATRQAAYEVLSESLSDGETDIAETSMLILDGEGALPLTEGARVAVATLRSPANRQSAVRVIRRFLNESATRKAALAALRKGLGDQDPDVAAGSVDMLWDNGKLPPVRGARAAVRALRCESSRETGVRIIRRLLEVGPTRKAALQAVRQGLKDEDESTMATCAMILAEGEMLSPTERAKAAVRTFHLASTRGQGARVIRWLLAHRGTRGAAIKALGGGLTDEWDIANTSAVILAEDQALPPLKRADAAVRAFLSEPGRVAGVRVIREFLTREATRPAALRALRKGLRKADRDVAGTSTQLLAENSLLPPSERCLAAVGALRTDSSRLVGVRVIRELLSGDATRPLALSALLQGRAGKDPYISRACAVILAEDQAFPAVERTRAALSVFRFDSTWWIGRRAIRRLLADEATREDTLGALTNGLSDDLEIAAMSMERLAEEGALPPVEGARAAVRALSSDNTREVGIRVIRGLLADQGTRETVLATLREGLDEPEPYVIVTSAVLLENERALLQVDGSRATIAAFLSGGDKSTAVGILRNLLAADDTRDITLTALGDWSKDVCPDLAKIASQLMAEERERLKEP